MTRFTTFVERRQAVQARKLTREEAQAKHQDDAYHVIDALGREFVVPSVEFERQFEPARERAAEVAPEPDVDPVAAQRAELQRQLDALG